MIYVTLHITVEYKALLCEIRSMTVVLFTVRVRLLLSLLCYSVL